MTQKRLPVSVAIITRNRPQSVERCLKSLFDMHELPEEVLVIDSSDVRNNQLLQRYPTIDYHHIDHVSAGFSRNLCLKKSKNNLLAFIDDDETASPLWLSHLHLAYKKTKAALISGPMYVMFEENYWNKVWKYLTRNDYTSIDRYVQFANTGNLLIDKNKIGHLNFDPTMRTSEDAEFYIKINQQGHKIFYSHRAITFHEYRTTLKSFFIQWFFYGYEDAHILAKQNLGMRRWYSLRTFYKSLVDRDLISPLSTAPVIYWFGLATKNCALVLGAFFRRTKIFMTPNKNSRAANF